MIAEPRSFRVSEGATRRPVTGRGEQAEGREPWLPHISMHAACQMPEMAAGGAMLMIPARKAVGAITHLHNFFALAMRKDAVADAAVVAPETGLHPRDGADRPDGGNQGKCQRPGHRAEHSRSAQKREGIAVRSTRKRSGHNTDALPSLQWSERPDSNRRPLDPQSSALPGCATLRHGCDYSDARAARNPGQVTPAGPGRRRHPAPCRGSALPGRRP